MKVNTVFSYKTLSVEFLAFKRQVRKNFSLMVFLCREVIYCFFFFFSVKVKIYFTKFQETTTKIP